MSKSTSDSTLKGLNWAGPKEHLEKVEEEEKTTQVRVGQSAPPNDLKGLFRQEKEGGEVAPGERSAPVIQPSLSAVRKPKPLRQKSAPLSEGASFKEPPAATFGGATKPLAISLAPSEAATKQAARGLFGAVESSRGKKPDLSMPSPAVSVPLTLKHAVQSPPASPAPSINSAERHITADSEAQAKAKRAEEPPVSSHSAKLHLEPDLAAAPRPSPTAAHASDIPVRSSENPLEPFVLPSPLPDKPSPPATPMARESSVASKQPKPTVLKAPIQPPVEPAIPLSVDKSDLESFPPAPVKRVGYKIWSHALIGVLIVALGGAAAVYSGLIKLPFEVVSLLGAAPKAASGKLQAPPVADEKPRAASVAAPPQTPGTPPGLPEAQPNQPAAREESQAAAVQPAVAPPQAQQAQPAAAENAAPLPATDPKAQEAQVPATEPPKKPTAVTPSPSAELKSSEDVSNAIARADRMVSKGELSEAEALLRAVLAKESDEHHAMEVLVRVLLKRGRPAEARPFAKRIVDKRPQRAPYRLLYGDVLAGVGERSAAEEQWREALAIDPSLSAATRRLGNSQ